MPARVNTGKSRAQNAASAETGGKGLHRTRVLDDNYIMMNKLHDIRPSENRPARRQWSMLLTLAAVTLFCATPRRARSGEQPTPPDMDPGVAEVLAKHPEDKEPDKPFPPDGPKDSQPPAGGEPKEDEPDPAASGSGMLVVLATSESGRHAARLQFIRADGTPVGGLPGLGWQWFEGTTRIRLPAGTYNLDASGGCRIHPHQGTVEIRPGTVTHYRLNLLSWAPLEPHGWFAGDPYLDLGDASNTAYPDIESAGVAARAEGLAFAGLHDAASRLGPLGLPYAELSNGEAQLTEAFARSSRATFTPLASHSGPLTGGARYYTIGTRPTATAADAEARPYFERLEPRRRSRDFVVVNQPAGRMAEDTGRAEQVAGELLFDIVAARQFDAMDIGGSPENQRIWQFLLNQGYNLPAISGGPALRPSKRPDVPGIGCYIASRSKSPGMKQIAKAIREGRVVVSTGPFVKLEVDGRGPGDTLPPSSKPRTVTLEALSSVAHGDTLKRIELLYNGRVLASWEGQENQKNFRLSVQKVLPDVGWVAVRYTGADSAYRAISNPVRITTPRFSAPPPSTARIELRLRGPDGSLPPQALVEVINYGVRVQTFSMRKPTLHLEVPATSWLRISAAGCASRTINLYRDAGPKAYIESLRKEGRLRKALTDASAYEHMRALLTRMRIDLTLAGQSR